MIQLIKQDRKLFIGRDVYDVDKLVSYRIGTGVNPPTITEKRPSFGEICQRGAIASLFGGSTAMWAAMATTPNNIVINPATQYNMVTIVYKLDHGEFSKSYNLGENSNDLANTINVIEEAFKLRDSLLGPDDMLKESLTTGYY